MNVRRADMGCMQRPLLMAAHTDQGIENQLALFRAEPNPGAPHQRLRRREAPLIPHCKTPSVGIVIPIDRPIEVAVNVCAVAGEGD